MPNNWTQPMQEAARREAQRLFDLHEELLDLELAGEPLAVSPDDYPFIFRIEQAGGIVDLLTGHVYWPT